MVILDTNIIIDHLRQKDKQTLLMDLVKEFNKDYLTISVLTIQELYRGKSTQDKLKEQYLLSVIGPLKIVPYTFEIATMAGQITRDLKDPIEFVDAGIAATAIVNGFKLATLNKKDFKDISELELI